MIYEFNGYKPVIDPSSFVHKEATIVGNVIIGKNIYIGPGASLRGDWGQIIIKDGCNIQDNCIVHIFPGKDVVLEVPLGTVKAQLHRSREQLFKIMSGSRDTL